MPASRALAAHPESVRRDLLPASAQLLCELIGVAATLSLCAALGGVRITASDPRVRAAIGEAKQRILLDHYGAERIEPPRCVAALRAVEAAEIVQRLAEGETAPELALEYGYTERWIWELKRRAGKGRAASPQREMFG